MESTPRVLKVLAHLRLKSEMSSLSHEQWTLVERALSNVELLTRLEIIIKVEKDHDGPINMPRHPGPII